MSFKPTINWEQELPVIKELGSLGWNMTQLAKKYGVSKQRIKQVTEKFIPDWADNYGFAVNRKLVAEKHFAKWGQRADTDLYQAQRARFRQKKANATRTGFTWDLSFGDIVWPTHCPILGLELDYYAESRSENSPSFDRIDNTKGYVKGNVHVLSWRANRIKNNGTSKEHFLIAEHLKKLGQ